MQLTPGLQKNYKPLKKIVVIERGCFKYPFEISKSCPFWEILLSF